MNAHMICDLRIVHTLLKCIFKLRAPRYLNPALQRGPTTFYLRAIL